jgi:hypothetical protein
LMGTEPRSYSPYPFAISTELSRIFNFSDTLFLKVLYIIIHINNKVVPVLRRLNSGNACYHSVQNLLSSHLPSRNIKYYVLLSVLLIYRTIKQKRDHREKSADIYFPYRVGSRSGLRLYSGVALVEFVSIPVVLAEILLCFPQPLQANAKLVLLLWRHHFLPSPSQYITHAVRRNLV